MYSKKDISVIIPTFNRSKDFKEKTLRYLRPFIKSLAGVIVVDQSNNDETKKLIKTLKIKNVKYVFSSPPSITLARNKGIESLSRKSKIVIFLDDDVAIEDNYFDEILRIFNQNPKVLAAAGHQPHLTQTKFQKIENEIKRFFILGYFEDKNARIRSAYSNTYPLKLDKPIKVQWLPGFNMAYKREVFRFQKFDKNLLGYTIAEDTDFSFRLYKKHPGSLIISPYPKIAHLTSRTERYNFERMAYINQIDHFYFNFKNLNRNFKEKLIFIWSIFGISLLRTLNLIVFPNTANYLKLKYYFKSLFYCLNNLDRIKKGRLREFESSIKN